MARIGECAVLFELSRSLCPHFLTSPLPLLFTGIVARADLIAIPCALRSKGGNGCLINCI